MIELTVQESTLKIAIACADCGHDLSVKVCRRGQEQWVEVWPCKTCLKSAYELATLRRTLDGITVTNGMKLFAVHPETKVVFDWQMTVRYASFEVRSTWDSDDSYVFHVEDCYSTREAAEAAKGANLRFSRAEP